MMPTRIEILGVPVDCVSMEMALDRAEEMIAGDKPQTVIAINPEKVMQARRDDALLGHLRTAGLLIPDGVGVVWAAFLLRLGHMRRVPGSEFMPALCERAARKGFKVFLYGGTRDVVTRTGEVLVECFPGLQIVGIQDGYIDDDAMPDLVRRINHSGAQILFVGLGSPKQELWMQRYLPSLNIRVCQGVGGTFDVLAGKIKRAPKLFRVLHLEWFYRLITDPRRVKRQRVLPMFAWLVLAEKFRGLAARLKAPFM